MTLTATKTKGIGDIVGHPLRIRSLIALTERIASPAELARDFKVDLGTLYAHIKKLEKAGQIELVRTEPTKGSTQHFYRAVQRPLMDDEESAALSDEERSEWTQRIVALIMADASLALEEGTFAKRSDHNVVRFPTSVDEQGWRDLGKAGEEFLERCMDVEAESAARRLESGEPAIPVRVASLIHEMSG